MTNTTELVGITTTTQKHRNTFCETSSKLQRITWENQKLQEGDTEVTELSKGHFCITNSEGAALTSTFLIAGATVIEITDTYQLMRLFKGHIEAEIQRRTCVTQLLLIARLDQALERSPWEEHSIAREETDMAQTNPPGSYCDEWGCLNKREQGALWCASCLEKQLQQTGTKRFATHPIHNIDKVSNIGRLTHSKRKGGILAFAAAHRSQPRSGTHRETHRTEGVGTPRATRRSTVFSKGVLKFLAIRSHFQRDIASRAQPISNSRIKRIQALDKPREGQGHRNTTIG